MRRVGLGAAIGLVMAMLATMSGCATTKPEAAATGVYSFWPPAPDEPRIQFLTSYAFSADVEPEPSGFDELVFGTERQVLPIGKPYGVAMWNGSIYVCDTTNPGVVILDLVKQETRVMITRGVEPMEQPSDIAIAPDGRKYVADRVRGRVFVFDAKDRSIGTFGWRGFLPVGVAVHGDELYVPDFQSQSVVVMDRFKGDKLRTIGETEGFVRPLGVEVDDNGDVYVTDVIRGRLQKFSPGGELIYARGQIADSPGNFVRPKHVVVDREGVIYVVDAAFQNVQMFNDEGEVLMYFGSPGSHPGAMSLPAGIAVHDDDLELFSSYVHPAFDARRLLVVTNQFGLNKVAIYAMGGLKEGRTVDEIAPVAADVEALLEAEPDDGVLRREYAPEEQPPAAEPEPGSS
jgi:DNA-binding beta-propeller fold protein YncE